MMDAAICFVSIISGHVNMFPGALEMRGSHGSIRLRAKGAGGDQGDGPTPVQLARMKLAGITMPVAQEVVQVSTKKVKFFSMTDLEAAKLRAYPPPETLHSHEEIFGEMPTHRDVQGMKRKRGTPGSSKDNTSSSVTDEEMEWRKDAPPRGKAYTRGSAKSLDDVKDDHRAKEEVRGLVYARTSRSSNKSRRQWWLARCLKRGIPPTPVTLGHLELAGALLAKGKYRSGKAYLSIMKRMHILDGHPWTDQLAVKVKDMNRAITRGLGPAKQAGPLPLRRIAELPAFKIKQARRPYWPAAGISAATISCAWLLREIESSTARCSDVIIHREGSGCGWAEWKLPVSKMDQEAKGTTRSLACACPSVLCPIAAMSHVLEIALKKRAWPRKPAHMCPLIVRLDGRHMAKDDVIAFYRDLTGMVGGDIAKIQGHSARVTGAMRMALAGHSEWVIQLFGRWASATVLRYVREALLGEKGGNLAQLTETVRNPSGKLGMSMQVIKRNIKKVVKKKAPRNMSEKVKPALNRISVDQVANAIMPNVMKAIQARTGAPKDMDIDEMIEKKVEKVIKFALAYGVIDHTFIMSCTGIKHVTLFNETTLCGWKYKADQVRVVQEGPGGAPSKEWCRTCVSRHTRLIAADV